MSWFLNFDSVESLTDAVARTQPGESAMYYVGHLAPERHYFGPDDTSPAPQDRSLIHEVASGAMELERRGVVRLVQERVRAGVWRYLFVRTGRPFVTRKTMEAVP